MKRTSEGSAKAGDPLLRETLEVMNAHQIAQYGGAPPALVKRLRLLRGFKLLEASVLPD